MAWLSSLVAAPGLVAAWERDGLTPKDSSVARTALLARCLTRHPAELRAAGLWPKRIRKAAIVGLGVGAYPPDLLLKDAFSAMGAPERAAWFVTEQRRYYDKYMVRSSALARFNAEAIAALDARDGQCHVRWLDIGVDAGGSPFELIVSYHWPKLGALISPFGARPDWRFDPADLYSTLAVAPQLSPTGQDALFTAAVRAVGGADRIREVTVGGQSSGDLTVFEEPVKTLAELYGTQLILTPEVSAVPRLRNLDLLIAHNVLLHHEGASRQNLVRELGRCLSPQGRLLLADGADGDHFIRVGHPERDVTTVIDSVRGAALSGLPAGLLWAPTPERN